MRKADIGPKKTSRKELQRTAQRLLDDNMKLYAFLKQTQQDIEKIHALACERWRSLPDSLLLPNMKKAKATFEAIVELAGPYMVPVDPEDVKEAAEDQPPLEVIKFPVKKGTE